MKRKKKILPLVLSAILIVVILGGCGKQKIQETDKSETSQNDELASIQKAGKFIVGIEGAYPPFNYHDDDGKLVGFDVEVAQKVAQKLGVEAEFVEAPWDSLLAGVDSGRFDTVINCVGVSDERKEKYDFSTYLYASTQILVRSDDDRIKTVEDLNGKTLAGNATNVYAAWFEEVGATLVPIDTAAEAINLLLSERADFLSFNSITFQSYMNEHPETKIKAVFEVPASHEQIAIPVRKGEQRLLKEIDKALQELREDGTLAALSEQYFNKDFTVDTSAENK
ncbi:MAG: transporter substrate-binding domain-containing protein [Lachnospiraceae bacterium]|nr:transporter substrate-binding domain-containing protein [Lachnospiraceae bacterium]